ncbi:MAG: hypothetical protein GEU91_18635 [Rhizobiales bacterium]|nr:hypothetical protein [Hyphomicrobiales bacterium]
MTDINLFGRWSEQEVTRLRHAVAEGLRGDALAALFPDRTPGAIEAKRLLVTKTPAQLAARLSRRRPRKSDWTEEEDAILIAGLDAGLSLEALQARLPGRNGAGINRRRWIVGLSDERREQIKLARRGEHKKPDPVPYHAAPIIVPEAVIEERDRRLLAQDRQALVARMMGDPPPGYSALDSRSLQSA